MSTQFNVAPSDAEYYYCVAYTDITGEFDYVDGYASGDEPTIDSLQDHARCNHSWEAGMMSVHAEDVMAVAAVRRVECGKCGRSYADRDALPLDVIEWEVKPTGRNA